MPFNDRIYLRVVHGHRTSAFMLPKHPLERSRKLRIQVGILYITYRQVRVWMSLYYVYIDDVCVPIIYLYRASSTAAADDEALFIANLNIFRPLLILYRYARSSRCI